MPVLHRPFAGNQDVQRHERAPARLSCPDRMHDHAIPTIGLQCRLQGRLFHRRQRVVHEAGAGPSEQRDAGDDDVQGHDEGDHGVEPLPAGRADGHHAGDHADGRPDVRHEVPSVSLERDRPVSPSRADEVGADREVDGGRHAREHGAGGDVVERHRMDQPPDGRPGDRGGGHDNQAALYAGVEVLGLLVAEQVLLVRRRGRHAQGEDRDQRGDEVHDRLERVREKADRPREPPGKRLERHRGDRRGHRQP